MAFLGRKRPMPSDRRAPRFRISGSRMSLDRVGRPQRDQFERAGVDRMKHRAAAAYSGCAMMSRRLGSGRGCRGHREATSGMMRRCAPMSLVGLEQPICSAECRRDRFGRKRYIAKGSDCDDVGQ
jgi:hypothetical protein